MRKIYLPGLLGFAIASLALTAAAFCEEAADAQGEAHGNVGEGHAEFHGFYFSLFNNKTKISCCHDKDCRPTVSRAMGDHYEVKINNHWMKIDKDAIIKEQAPDGKAHVCAGTPSELDPEGRVYCVILPPEG